MPAALKSKTSEYLKPQPLNKGDALKVCAVIVDF